MNAGAATIVALAAVFAPALVVALCATPAATATSAVASSAATTAPAVVANWLLRFSLILVFPSTTGFGRRGPL